MENLIFELVLSIFTLVILPMLSRWLLARYGQERLRTAVQVAQIAAEAVEQIARKMGKGGSSPLTPAQKMHMAVERAKILGDQYGIRFTEDQWRALIEAAVNGWNRFRDELNEVS